MVERIDPVTLQVIYQRLASIAEEMLNVLLKSSYSSIVKEGEDCSTAIFDAQGRTVAQSCAIPIHTGTLMFSVPQILREFPASEAKEGDIYLANDPYSGGTHLPDITLVTPVIHKGEVVALSVSMVHHQDIGAMTPGVPTSAISLYQEGLNLPPLKFYESGKPVKVVHDIIRNNVRVPEVVLGDLGAQVAAGNVGKVRILELFDEYGKELTLSAMKQLMDHAETLTRNELRKIPDGNYAFVEYMDNDGIDLEQRIKLQVSITIKGSDLIVDFSGSNPQVKGPFNCVPSSTYAAPAYVLKVITGGNSIPNNDGSFRPIKLILPEGSIVNPYPPAACGARAATIQALIRALRGALIKAVPERLDACPGASPGGTVYFGGHDPQTGKEYVASDLSSPGIGARFTKDGVDAIKSDGRNGMNIPIEAFEAISPYMVLEYALYENSGGAGKYRGGLGVKKSFRLLRGHDASVTYRGEGHFVSSWGVFGGRPGALGKATIIRKTGEAEEIPSKKDFRFNEGDELHFLLGGGGGYGDPLERKPELVLRDVLDGRVSLKAAADDYGVVIDEELVIVDEEKTIKLREDKTKTRGPVTWTYDRGAEGRE